ncbi:MAG TPA: tetratricopeptide repeat protein [Rhodanobacteraceae bacterium]
MAPIKPGFLEELKRRHVWRVAAAYAIAGWLIVQIATQVFPFFNIPNWGVRLVVILIVIGFPVAVAFAWIYELTPEGIRRTEPADSPDARPASTNRQIGRKLNALIVAVLVLAVALLAWRLIVVRHAEPAKPALASAAVTAKPPASAAKASVVPATHVPATVVIAAQPIPAKSVAVLPFENLSADKNNAYFADGMQDLILTKLADIGDLKVIARTSTQSYGSHPENLSLVGKQLGVATILEGSVQKAGNQVLINVQLIDVKSDSHIWAQSYTRTLTNIFGVEGEVAEKVATALNAKLTAKETTTLARTLTNNPQAYTLYLKAQYEIDQYLSGDGQPERIQQADTYLQQAIAHDSQFAAAYAALARTELIIRADAIEATDANLKDVRAHAEKAIALQPDLAGGHIALSRVLMDTGDSGGASRELETAARLAPNDAYVQSRFSVLHSNLDDWNQALVDAGNALRLDPRSGVNYGESGFLYGALRNYNDARQMLERGLAISPHDQNLRSSLADLYLLLGDPAQGRAQLAMLPPNARGRPGGMAYAWLLSRDYPEVLKAAEQIPHRKVWRDAGNRSGWIGLATTLLGDHARAQSAFDQARQEVLAAMSKHPGWLQSQLAWVEMWSGHRNAALQASDKAMSWLAHMIAKYKKSGYAMNPVSAAPDVYETRAEIFAHFGDAKHATNILRQLFETKGTGWAISVPQLKLDPVWDPIRHDPAFQALLKKYAKDNPAITDSNPPPTSGSGTTMH